MERKLAKIMKKCEDVYSELAFLKLEIQMAGLDMLQMLDEITEDYMRALRIEESFIEGYMEGMKNDRYFE